MWSLGFTNSGLIGFRSLAFRASPFSRGASREMGWSIPDWVSEHHYLNSASLRVLLMRVPCYVGDLKRDSYLENYAWSAHNQGFKVLESMVGLRFEGLVGCL